MDTKMEQEAWAQSIFTVGSGQNQPVLHNPTWVQPGADFELDTGTCDHGYPSEGFIQFACEEEQHLGGVVGAFYIMPH